MSIRSGAAVSIWGLAMSAAFAGNMMIGDSVGSRIIKIDDYTGAYRGVAAVGGGLNTPMGMAYGSEGMLYVANRGTNQIKRYTDSGVYVDDYASTPTPHGLTFYDKDPVVANDTAGTISRFGHTPWVSAQSARAYHAVVSRNGRLFASWVGAGQGGIEEFEPNSGLSLGDFVPASASLASIQGFGWAADGRLFASNTADSKIYVFAEGGGSAVSALNVDGSPIGLRFTSSGDILASMSGSGRVSRVSPSTGRIAGDLLPNSFGLQQAFYIERVNPSIECRLIFSDRTSNNSPVNSISVEFSFAETGQSLQSRTVPVDALGRFKITTPGFLSQYDIRIKTGTWLAKKAAIDTNDMSRAWANFTLINGDCDASNTIDAGDYGIIAKAFGTTAGAPGWDVRGDLNGDGTVNEGDMDILAANYAKTGE